MTMKGYDKEYTKALEAKVDMLERELKESFPVSELEALKKGYEDDRDKIKFVDIGFLIADLQNLIDKGREK